ncbi:MAG TPA: HAD-IA family hydrolase [Actinocrinis sp.]
MGVEAVVNSADTGYEKSNPRAFRAALAALAEPRRVWMIGDNPVADVGGATAAGLGAILVRAADPGNVTHHAAGLDALIDIVGSAADR